MIPMRTNTEIVLAACVLLGGVVAMAQQPPAAAPAPGQQQPLPAETVNPNAVPATGTATDMQGDNIPTTMADEFFLRCAFEDGVAEAEMGRLAALLSPSRDVKQFGQNIALVHEVLNSRLEPMAERRGVLEPKDMPRKQKEEIARMRTLSGANFDAEFVKVIMKAQQRDLQHYKDEAKDGKDPAVQQLARKGEMILNRRMQVLELLAQNHNLPLESKQ